MNLNVLPSVINYEFQLPRIHFDLDSCVKIVYIYLIFGYHMLWHLFDFSQILKDLQFIVCFVVFQTTAKQVINSQNLSIVHFMSQGIVLDIGKTIEVKIKRIPYRWMVFLNLSRIFIFLVFI